MSVLARLFPNLFMDQFVETRFVIERTTDCGNTWLLHRGRRVPVWCGDKSRAHRFITQKAAEAMIDELHLVVSYALRAARLDELHK